jgi:hypothetical protein
MLMGIAVLGGFLLAPVGAAWLLRLALAHSEPGPSLRALRSGAVLAAALTVLYVVWFFVSLYAVSSSTAALGVLVLPFTETAVFVLGLAVGWAAARVWGWRPASGAGSVAARLLACAVLLGAALGGVSLGRFLLLERRAGDAQATPGELRATLHAYREGEDLYAVYQAFLARAANTLPLARLATNPAAPEDVLVELARHPDGSVVWRALSNPKLGPERLRELAAEGQPAVRANLARNPNTPPDVLRELAEHESPQVDLNLVMHPALPEELRDPLFERLARADDRYIRNSAAAQPGMPPRLLRQLAADDWPLLRQTVASNRATPLDTLEQLAADPDERVRRIARIMLERRAKRRGE